MLMSSFLKKTSGVIIAIIMLTVIMMAPLEIYAAADETEPNNNRNEANIIEVGTTVYGERQFVNRNNGYYQDNDYFRFTAPLSGNAELVLWHDDSTNSALGTGISISDSTNELASVEVNPYNKPTASVKFGLVYGEKYYINTYAFGAGQYDSSYHFIVKYVIGKTTLTSVKARTKGFRVQWDKKSNASFYQVQYTKKSTYSDYAWSKAKTVNVSSGNSSKTIKNLSKKKQYYVRVRVVRTIDGKTYYSAWSSKKLVKTK